ncbi:MAG: DJ-1/PfpI family protein [Liquorilactobacillus hordei]|uniref:Protease, dj-1 pfpi family protein n=2 Tax=Liquorilactobacillus hordei TaxID=468911 RepID=A0A0R1MEU2_9LACO|nr:DJ-1/PfpI family protein [Liquorilactobacillus hordei]AUJ29761.1 DJ-1 family protein [Liquorilactobacillus hordei]KRL06669.1 protease, dj-1 pfpi family protein [Liquorilactobacillus hordei DSM 19519]MBZ2404969.1 DJ-1 family protein [Liquorilactobacillus hordei]QYH52405.1 DJ-1/PfpI family protein [Liquorilactobacillus hordei DSM 19519]
MKKILLLLADGFESYEASVFTDVFGWNLYEGNRQTELFSVGLHDTLKCTWGYSCVPNYQLSEINLDDYDALAIPGGFEEADFYADAFDEQFLNVIRYFDSRNKPIAAICVAALSLGKSGVLKGRSATTYYYPNNPRQKQLEDFGAIVLKKKSIVVDRNIITSSSPATALDVAFWLLEQLTTTQNLINIKTRMGFLAPDSDE